MRRIGSVWLWALLLALFAGCSEGGGEQRPAPEGPATPSRKTFAVIPKGTTHEFWKSVEAGARDAENEFGVSIRFLCRQDAAQFRGRFPRPTERGAARI